MGFSSGNGKFGKGVGADLAAVRMHKYDDVFSLRDEIRDVGMDEVNVGVEVGGGWLGAVHAGEGGDEEVV